jgi:hypothetical protein
MSLAYKPLNGTAGKIVCQLHSVGINDIGSPIGDEISLYVTDFSEEPVESELNSEFLNNLGYYTQDHYGWHQTISFSLINGSQSNRIGSATQENIVRLVSYINLIKQFPRDYRLEIKYRTGDIESKINDAQYIGGFKLNEISKNSDIGQTISMSFREKQYKALSIQSSVIINKIEAEISNTQNRIVFIGEESNAATTYIYITSTD